MKRLATVIAILIVIICTCIFSLVKLFHTKNEMLSTLEEAYRCVEQQDIAKALDLTEQFSEQWESNEKHLLLFVRHQELDEINSITAGMYDYLAYEDLASYMSYNARIQELIAHIWKSELPLVQNIM